MAVLVPPVVCPVPPPRLPKKPYSGQYVCDELGNVWEYDIVIDSWIFRGTLTSPPLVTEAINGLVTPDVFDHLQYIKQVTGGGINFRSTLKLLPNVDAYWYLFESGDKLFKFTVEGVNKLRIEVDQGRLYQLFAKLSVAGPKGITGLVGDQGRPGFLGDYGQPGVCGPGPTNPICTNTEPCYNPTSISVDGLILQFSIKVATPLTTDISLRLFTSRSQPAPIVTVVVPVVGSAGPTVAGTDPNYILDITRTAASIDYDQASTLLTGTLVLDPLKTTKTWIGTNKWCLKALQRGPTGPAGADAVCYTVACCALDVSVTIPSCPLISVRQDCATGDVYTVCAAVNACVDHLRLPGAAGCFGTSDIPPLPPVPLGECSPPFFSSFDINAAQGVPGMMPASVPGDIAPGTVVSGRLAAVQASMDDCKNVVLFEFPQPTDQIPTLTFPNWQPQANCDSCSQYSHYNLDWIPTTDLPACSPANTDGSCPRFATPDGLAPLKFPFLIIMPGDPCGQDCDPCQRPTPPTTVGPTTGGPTTGGPTKSPQAGTSTPAPSGGLTPFCDLNPTKRGRALETDTDVLYIPNVTAGNGSLLVVSVACRGTPTVQQVSWNGQDLLLATSSTNQGNSDCEIWYLDVGTDGGAGNVVIKLTGTADAVAADAVTVDGLLTNDFSADGENTGTGTNPLAGPSAELPNYCDCLYVHGAVAIEGPQDLDTPGIWEDDFTRYERLGTTTNSPAADNVILDTAFLLAEPDTAGGTTFLTDLVGITSRRWAACVAVFGCPVWIDTSGSTQGGNSRSSFVG